MKKYLTFQFIMIVMLVCQAQVGINTENPHGVLDVQNEPNQNFGMVVPTVESLDEVSTPDGTDVLNGTIVYDASRDALCVKLVKGWSCFDGGTDPVDPNDPTDPSDPSNPSDPLPDFTNATQEAYVKSFNTKEDDYFGYSVAISADGNTLAVGAYAKDSGFDNDAGAVYVFFRTDNEWEQQAYIQASNLDRSDLFGIAIALSADGSTLAVGATDEDSNATGVAGSQNDRSGNSGAVYIFTRNGTTWSQQEYIKASNTESGDRFGNAVSLSADGNTLAVGTKAEESNATGINGDQTNNDADSSGAVYVFTRSGIIWSQQAYIKASNAEESDKFGTSVSLSADGNTLAVGAPNESSNATGINVGETNNDANLAGAVYVFTRSGSSWVQHAYIKASNTEGGDNFGGAVSLSGDGKTLAVGVIEESSNSTGVDETQDNNLAPLSGAVYVFALNNSNWEQEAYVKASNTGAADEFGVSVSLSGDGNTLAVGAHLEKSDTTGINPNDNDSAGFSGAAYVFVRDDAAWSQQAFIKASNTEGFDYFGWDLALSSEAHTLAVGAYREDSPASDIDGYQGNNNNSSDSGAVYVFEAP